ncbi:helix-turn-helix domain-containing protein [Prevotella pallens]|uniref:helix-turn-helix domain-containing protein n=1 Tax=Prevotella pallens TaxID=60133 RepID=UPI0020518E04|nr:helix-turn-helix transcriptional regulator [Prevotella pallens]DAR85260.1 MAG TPA: helix-turn-helix domain protein [Caudoviricetes sp.]
MRIKEILKEKGITLSQLADTMGVSRQALSRQVAGKLLVEKAEEIATALNVPMWQLFASPEDVQKENSNIVCPHCGNSIKVTIIKE